MVTAIVIPIICLYFFWLTRKEMKEQDAKWHAASKVRHEAVLTGEIKNIIEEKQRFYYHRYIYVITLQLQTSTKFITAKQVTPITKTFEKDIFTAGNIIRVYGSWEGSKFLFSDYEIEKR
ncbi:hypothetical protein [Neobacillus soli]|uniref:hypothetical protein n=1 Tax=Neobacillus soli TaxID=220688 RepID=UPI00082496EB|nr:hypothetical protein [Neobacillus soli]